MLWITVAVFLIYLPLVSAQTSYMTIYITEDAPAHITITVRDSENIAELRGIIKEPSILSIYREQLGLVFGTVENLELSVDSGVFIVEFDSPIATSENGVLTIGRRDFNGRIDTVSTLKIIILDYALVDSDPAPDKVSENAFEWHGVDFIPQVRYRKQDTFPSKGLAAAIVVLFVLATAGYFKWKKGR